MDALSSSVFFGAAGPSARCLHSAAKHSPASRQPRRSLVIVGGRRLTADDTLSPPDSSSSSSSIPLPASSIESLTALTGNWVPVDELPPTSCTVVNGTIPSALRGGAYVRNGPNPQHLRHEGRQVFEGDGMLHSLLFPACSGGAAHPVLCSRFVRTYRYLLEEEAGKNLLPNVFSEFNGYRGLVRAAEYVAGVLTRQIDFSAGLGQANTSLAYIGGRLFALDESDLPYAVHLSPAGDLTTLGRQNFDGKLSSRMTAHPKKDPLTGEVFAMRYNALPPFLTYFWFDAEGKKRPDVPVFSLREASFLHDFAVTERYAVFCENQIAVQPMNMVLFGGPLVVADPEKVPRLGILPRDATSDRDMKWIDAPAFNPLHTINAWEEDGGAVVVLLATNMQPVEQVLARMDLAHSLVEMVTVDLRNETVTRTPLSTENLELSVINPNYLGRRTRYLYAGVGRPLPNMAGVVKLDTEKKGRECVVACRMYGPGRFGGEPFFVPAPDEGDGEDDGYLLTYVHDENTAQSSFLVMDARSPDLEVVAEVALPGRVPYGFHGLFLSAEELQAQKDKEDDS